MLLNLCKHFFPVHLRNCTWRQSASLTSCNGSPTEVRLADTFSGLKQIQLQFDGLEALNCQSRLCGGFLMVRLQSPVMQSNTNLAVAVKVFCWCHQNPNQLSLFIVLGVSANVGAGAKWEISRPPSPQVCCEIKTDWKSRLYLKKTLRRWYTLTRKSICDLLSLV